MRFTENLSIVLIFCFIFLVSVNLAYDTDGFIIAADDSSNIYYVIDNGDGTFSDYARINQLGGIYARGVTINDFNNDGHMDFVAGRSISSTAYLYLFLNNGSNNFTKSAMIGAIRYTGNYAIDMTSGDYNNDGNMDFIAYMNSTTIGFFLGDGNGNFTNTVLFEEALADEGIWDLTLNASPYVFDTEGIVSYDRTEVLLFENLFVDRSATGETIQYKFEPGTYNVNLSVSDVMGMGAGGTIPMIMQPEDPPVADAGGPYSADESDAFEGGWTFSLDGSGSSDDVEIRKYVWDFGVDPFDGTEMKSGKWFTNGGTDQDDEVSLTGVSTWDTRYIVSKATFPKVTGQVFQARIKTTGSGRSMFGFKNTNTSDFHYNQFPYEFFLSNGSIYIYENTNNRGYTGFDYSYNTWYDFRIELKETGAVYSYRPSGTELWYEVYNSDYTTSDTSLRKGMVVCDGTFTMDDFLETTAGVAPDFTLYFGTGAFSVDLTVYDRSGQSDTDNILVNITSGDIPIAYAGPDQNLDETGATDGNWAVGFDASASADDYGIYTYEWDWDYDPPAGFNPSGDTGANVLHSWSGPGTYSVAVKVTDHALQSHVDTMTVNITIGNPPTADAGGPYVVDELPGNASSGGWTVSLDGSGSSDPESNIDKYIWDLGTDTFNGTVVNDSKWALSSSGVTQNDEVSITGDGTWGNRYFCSNDSYNRAWGAAFEAKIKQTGSGSAVIGFKNDSDSGFHYNQWTYSIYFYNGNIYIYEDGSSRGCTGIDYSFNTWYEIRIELKETQGAIYYYRAAGSPTWILLYDSNHSNASSLKRGITVNTGICIIDDIREIATGSSPSYLFYGPGIHAISLTVFDQANQKDTCLTTVTTLASNPPAVDADAGDDIIWAYDMELSFDASGSSHMDPTRSIVLYEWDFDGDGTWDYVTTDPSDPNAKYTYPDPDPNTNGDSPWIFTVYLRVTDDNDPAQTDIDTREVTVAEPPHVPFAEHGGPYTAKEGIPFTLFTMVTVVENLPPVADAGGSYFINEGTPLQLDGSRSYEPNGDTMYFAWDLDDDGSYDDADSATPIYTWMDNGIYTVTLTVTDDDGAMDTLSQDVTITDNAPVAHLSGDNTLDEGETGNYDASGSVSYPDVITGYEWDWDYDGVTFNPSGDTGAIQSHSWMDDGTYTVAVRATDDDGSTDIATLTVVVSSVNKPPEFQSIGPQSMDEGESLSIPLSATDPDTGDTLTLSGTGLPDFCLIIDNKDGTGSIECNPTYSNSGSYPIIVIVTDDGVPNLSDSKTFTLTVNDISQEIPSILDLSTRPEHEKFQLTWSPVPGALCYNIYRSPISGETYTLIASCHVTDYCSYMDHNVVNGITYCYMIKSISLEGIESVYSNEVCINLSLAQDSW